MANNNNGPVTYSFSRIELYDGCPFKYYLKYECGNFVPSGGSVATEFGSALHLVEEAIANDIKAGVPIDYVKHKNKFIKEVYRLEHKYPNDFYERDKSGRTYMEKAMEYMNTEVYRLEQFMKDHPTYEILGAEVEFHVTDNGHKFYGKIDRLLRDNATGQYIIHDVKSYNMPKTEEELTTPLQFVVYVMAVAQMYGCSEDDVVCGFDLPLCNIIQMGGTKGYMKRGRAKIAKLFDGIEIEHEYKPKPKPLCHWCDYCRTNDNAQEPYKNLCPYYSLWLKTNKTNEVENKWYGMDQHEAVYEAFLAKYNIKVSPEMHLVPKGGE